MSKMTKPFEAVFAEWDRRYREDPVSFMSQVEHLLGHTPQSYGEACAIYFESLLDEMAAGKSWESISILALPDTAAGSSLGNASVLPQ